MYNNFIQITNPIKLKSLEENIAFDLLNCLI